MKQRDISAGSLSVQPSTKFYRKPLSNFRDEPVRLMHTTSPSRVHFMHFAQMTCRRSNEFQNDDGKFQLTWCTESVYVAVLCSCVIVFLVYAHVHSARTSALLSMTCNAVSGQLILSTDFRLELALT
jgi:hypothetical protein